MAVVHEDLLQRMNRFGSDARVDPCDIDIGKPNRHPAGPPAAIVSNLLSKALFAAEQSKSRPGVGPTQRAVGPHSRFAYVACERVEHPTDYFAVGMGHFLKCKDSAAGITRVYLDSIFGGSHRFEQTSV